MFLTGKNAVVTGVASQLSIAYGIANALKAFGANVILTYQNERLRDRVQKLADTLGAVGICPCDVSDDQQLQELAPQVQTHFEHVDILIHSIAFAPREQLMGNYAEVVNREDFTTAHDVSSYSLSAITQALLPVMNPEGAAVTTMSYIGATRTIPNYNVMGIAKASLEASVRYLAYSLGDRNIRVNAVSAGPIKTLAASGIQGFKQLIQHVDSCVPLKKGLTTEEVGQVCAFLSSSLASAITGEVIYVDNGFHLMSPITVS